jgi:O-methyltransferase
MEIGKSTIGGRYDTILTAIKSTEGFGEIWECGAYGCGTALKMAYDAPKRKVRAFDTFEGLPYKSEYDWHGIGTMASSYDECVQLFKDINNVTLYKGVMPKTFIGLENSIISVAHIDVDQYQSVKEVLEWVYPRVHLGGYIIIDDYNCGACKGAKIATDNFFKDKPEKMLYGPDPQVWFVKC